MPVLLALPVVFWILLPYINFGSGFSSSLLQGIAILHFLVLDSRGDCAAGYRSLGIVVM